MSKPFNPPGIPCKDDPMQEDHKNERKLSQWVSHDQDGYLSGWFLLFMIFSTQTQIHYKL